MKRLSLLLVCVACAGCGAKGSDPVTETPRVSAGGASLPAGWKSFRVTGFEVGLPKEWQVLDLTTGDFEKMMSSVSWPGTGGAQLKAQVKAMAQSGMVKLFAFAPTKEAFATNLNVNAIPVNITDLEEIKRQGVIEIGKMTKNVKGEVAHSPDRVIIDASMVVNGPNGPIQYESHAHQLIHKGQLYTFTFSCSPATRKDVEGVAAQAVQTIKFD